MFVSSVRCSLFVGVLAALSLLASGCGGSKPPSVANVGTTTSSGQAPVQQDSLKYSECMRANGVPNFPDPKAGGGFEFQTGTGIDPASPVFKTAQAKCRKFMPGGGPPGPGSSTHPTAQAFAQMLKVAQCMRRHGVSDFPDPRTSVPANPFGAGGAGVISDIDGVILVFPSTIDQQSPVFTRAASACKFPLHNH